jgi:hypothetical protein
MATKNKITKKESHLLLAVHVTDRVKEAPLVQKTLTQFGDAIRTRLGLHEIEKDFASPSAIMILDIVGESKASKLKKSLDKIKGIETKLVVFKH